MVYFYNAEDSVGESSIGGKGKCYALGRCNDKIQLISYDSYVILLTKQPNATPYAFHLIREGQQIFMLA